MVRLGYTHLQVIPTHKYLAHHKLLQSLQVVVSMCIQPGCMAGETVCVDGARMDISVLPNNNHPEKFFQLDVGMLPATHGMFHVGALMSSQRHWQNRVYSQVWMSQPLTAYSSLCVLCVCVFKLAWIGFGYFTLKIYQIKNVWCEFSLEMCQYHFSFPVQISIPELMYHSIRSTDPITVYIII